MAYSAENRAARLLERTRLVDGHNDLPYVIWRHRDARGDARVWDLAREHPEHDTDIPKLRAGQVATQIFTAFIPTAENDPLRARLEVIDVMLQMEQAWPEAFHPVLEPRDIARARKAGKIGLLKAVEGLVGVDNLAHLRLFHAMGIRLVTLCHNETLPFIDSATDVPGKQPLNEFGRAIIGEMERLGLIIDLAHVSPLSQHAVMDVATGPVIISHANAHALCPHPRNAPDDVMRRIADGGGMVMATFVPVFLSPEVYLAMRPAMDLDHMKNLIGAEAIGIGSDLYGGPKPPGLEDASTFPRIFAELIRRKWKTRELEMLAGGNFERVWRALHRPDIRLAG